MACQLASNSAPGQQAAGGEQSLTPGTAGRNYQGVGGIAGSLSHLRDSPGTSARKSLKNPAGKTVKTIKSGVAKRGKLACQLASISATSQQAARWGGGASS